MTKPPVALFIFFNDSESSLGLGKESQNVKDIFRIYDNKNFIRCEVETQVTIEKLFKLFDFYKGRIILLHFAGHADGKGIYLDNHAKVEGLSRLFKREVEDGQLQLVFLNGCSTVGQVKLLSEAGVPSVIATNCPINDQKAIDFSKRFYESLTNINAKTTLKEAFENSKTRLLTDSVKIKETERGFIYEDNEERFEWEFYPRNENWILPNTDVSITRIRGKFKQKSGLLREAKSSFKGNYTVEKKEVQKIINWIGKEDKKNRICIVHGSAGIGKTSILKEVLVHLEKDNIPVLGIKVDKFPHFSSLQDLQKKLELNESISEIFRRLSSNNSKVVLILDQLDALSFSLSGNREVLKMYYNLIIELKDIAGVHIIFSARTFDIENDVLLKDCVRIADTPSEKSDGFKVEIQNLQPQQIKAVLKQNNTINFDEISQTLQVLLGTPLHLEIFLEIYDDTIDLKKLTSLERLYDELWDKDVNSEEEDVLYKAADRMSKTKKLSCSTRSLQVNKDRVATLASKGLIVKQSNNIHFFHQTFFDYVFARYFVQSEQSLKDYIFKNHQGLFIRPHIKSVLDFFRGEDEVRYQEELKYIINEGKTRFHIRLLITNMIGTQSTSSYFEQQIVLENIFLDNNLKGAFLEQVNLVSWWSFLLKKGIIDELVEHYHNGEQQYRNPNLSHRFLVKSGRLLPNEILEYLDRKATLKDASIVQAVLHGLEDWTNPLSIRIYEKFESQVDNFSKRFFLENALKYQFAWVLEKLTISIEETLKSEIDDYNNDYDFKNIFDALFEQSPKKSISFGLNIIRKGIKQYQNQPTDKGYFSDSLFGFRYSFIETSSSNHKYLEKLMTLIFKTLINISEKDRDYALKIIDDLLITKYLTLHYLGLSAFIKSNTNYSVEVFDYFIRYRQEGLLNNDDRLAYHWQLLIGKYIEGFTKEQREIIALFILNLPSTLDKETYLRYKQYYKYSNHGILELKYLSTFPDNIINENKQLKKRYQELLRKFPNDTAPREPISTSMMIGTESPIARERLKKMNKTSLKNLVKTHSDKNKSKGFGEPLYHDIGEDFRQIVKENPDEYAKVVQDLIDEKECPESRIVEGIQGLHEGLYDIHKFKPIFKSAILRVGVNSSHTRQLIWVSEYFVNTEQLDNDILDFLEDCIDNYDSYNDEDMKIQYNNIPNTKQKANDLMTKGINTTVGAACYTIMKMNRQSDLKERIFHIIKKASKINDDKIKATILAPLGQLERLDRTAILDLFLELIKTDSEELLYLAIHPAYRIFHIDFEQIIPYLKRISRIESTQETAGQILMAASLSKYSKSEILLKEALDLGNNVVIGALKVSFKWIGGIYTSKCLEIINKYVLQESRNISFIYELAFQKFKVEDFEQWQPMMEQFVSIPRINMSNFYKYLLNCVKDYPSECIDLLENFNIHHIEEFSFNNTKALDVLLEAYRNLDKTDFNQGEKAMNIFDKMIQHPTYRENAKQIVEKGDLR